METAIYCRVSTDEQAQEGFSIRAQEQKLKEYARVKDWSIFNFYIDEGISGKNITARPAINRMIDDIKAGNVKNVLVFKLDRLTRSVADLVSLMDIERRRIMLWEIVEQLQDRKYRDFLKQLVSSKIIKNSAALDITKMILEGRRWQLSKKQVKVFTDIVYFKYKYQDKRCRKCKKYIYWDELADAINNGYRCRDCFL